MQDPSLGEIISGFIRENVVLVGGGALFGLSLLVLLLAVACMAILKLKHNRLRRRVRRKKGGTTKRKHHGKPGMKKYKLCGILVVALPAIPTLVFDGLLIRLKCMV